jgi:hypothetical protein
MPTCARDIAFFFKNICLFVAHGTLGVSLTARARRQRLAQLGFVLEGMNRPPSRVLAWAFVAYIAIFLVFRVAPLLLDGSPEARGPIWISLVRAVMIATVQVVAIMVAILPKFRYGFANEDLHGHAPLSFVVGAGFVATAVAIPIQLWFYLLMHPGPMQALEALGASYPWLSMPFVTAVTFAYLVQDSRWSISEFPDNETAMACLMLVLGQGAVQRIKTTPLISQDAARAAMERAHEVLQRT